MILLILGALCVLAAGAVFVAVAWTGLPLALRILILLLVTASFGLVAQLALRRGLQATAEAMAATACGMFVLDLAAARSAGLLGLAYLAEGPFEIVAGLLLAALALAGVMAVRSQQHRLWSLDVAVALGVATAAVGVLSLDVDGYAGSFVALTVILSLLSAGWGRLRLPVARWGAVGLGAASWLAAVALGSERATELTGAPYPGTTHVSDDLGRLASAWPALTMALVAAIWSKALTRSVWRRVAAGLCLLPVLLVVEIVGWSHGWVVGTVVVLAGYVIAAMASGHVPTVWSPAVAGSAVVLAVSAVVCLVPTMTALAVRLVTPLDPSTGALAPWLLPLTTLTVLAVLPRVSVGDHRLFMDHRHTAGALAAALAVMPILSDVGPWVSMTVLVMVAAPLLLAARAWHSDVLLVLGLLLLTILGTFAHHDALALPLAWTVIAAGCLAWARTEARLVVRAGFLVAAGLSALFGTAHWLSWVQMPGALQGLAVVGIGSVGLVVSQGLGASQGRSGWPGLPDRARTRLVGEGLSVTWMFAGLVMVDSPSPYRALELTVMGVAAGITGYLSADRHRAGWVSGLLLTIASWIRLADNDIQGVEWYTLPAATALLVYGARRLRRGSTNVTTSTEPTVSSWRCLGPGLALALGPSLLLAVEESVSWRGLLVGLGSVALVAVGVGARVAAPFALGVAATGLLAVRNVWPVVGFIPRWTLLFVIGGALLATGMTWESRVKDVRTASRYIRGLR